MYKSYILVVQLETGKKMDQNPEKQNKLVILIRYNEKNNS